MLPFPQQPFGGQQSQSQGKQRRVIPDQERSLLLQLDRHPRTRRQVLEQALRSVDFLVVQDGFHPTPTSDFADLVLPAAIWGEKEGTYTNSERRVSKVNKAVEPPGEARPDFDIFLALGEKLGCREEW